MNRKYLCRRSRRDGTEAVYQARYTGPLPQQVDLRPFCPPVRDQGQLGACTAFAGTGLRESMMLVARGSLTPLSELWLYYWSRQDKDQDEGASPRDTLDVMAKMGVAPENADPYDPSRFAAAPCLLSDLEAGRFRIHGYACLDASDGPPPSLAVQAALADKQCLFVAINVWPCFETPEPGGVVAAPDVDSDPLGGHALLCCGYDLARGVWIIQNSWGTDYGDGGFCFLPIDRYPLLEAWTAD